ncbi:MAG: hypothetical protein GVY04_10895 [Cyanobacteria bacterium]|nr:hypothetical protein [Cyanobacteria bacterium GSL.Bin1]
MPESSINRNHLSSLLSPQSYQFGRINRIPNDRSSKVDVFDTSQAVRAYGFNNWVVWVLFLAFPISVHRFIWLSKKALPVLRLKWGTEKIRWLPLSQVGQLGAESLSAIALEGKRMSILLTFEILATLLAVSHQ